MPVLQCPNGKWRIGEGKCMYETKADAERAYAGYRAAMHAKSLMDDAVNFLTPEKNGEGMSRMVKCKKCQGVFDLAKTVEVSMGATKCVHCGEVLASADMEDVVKFEPPESGDAPKAVKDILSKVYNSCRSDWVKDHPDDKENAHNKEYCSRVAWESVHFAGYNKTGDGKWSKSKVEKLLSADIPIKKIDTEKRIVYGIVYEPDITDAQNDFADAEEIEKACHQFMIDYQQIGHMHQDMLDKADVAIVENYIAPSEFLMGSEHVRKGSWVLGVKVNNEDIWQAVKKGELTGFSMAGFCMVPTIEDVSPGHGLPEGEGLNDE